MKKKDSKSHDLKKNVLDPKVIESYDRIIRSSVQVLLVKPEYTKPEAFGSGCIISYKDNKYLLSVRHVTDYDLTTTLETNLPPEGSTSTIKPVGGLIYFDQLKLEEINPEELLKKIEQGGEKLDITFGKIEEPLVLLQSEINFGIFNIEVGEKRILDETNITIPDKDDIYGFFGNVRHSYIDGIYLQHVPTLKNNLKYHRTKGNFHIFIAPKVIKDEYDYKGCSGAPIMDSNGNVVALASAVLTGTSLIYGFSIEECMRLLKISIETGQI